MCSSQNEAFQGVRSGGKVQGPHYHLMNLARREWSCKISPDHLQSLNIGPRELLVHTAKIYVPTHRSHNGRDTFETGGGSYGLATVRLSERGMLTIIPFAPNLLILPKPGLSEYIPQ